MGLRFVARHFRGLPGLHSLILWSGAGRDRDANGDFDRVNRPRGIRVGRQFLRHGFGELRSKMPEPRMPARFDQAHYPVPDQEKGAHFDNPSNHQFIFHSCAFRYVRAL